MCAFDAGNQLVVLPRVAFARSAVVAAMFSLAGCSSAGTHYTAENVAVATPTQVAQAAEAEDDGRPTQGVPTGRLRALPDEPAEPFSKNYGGRNPSAERNAANKNAAPAVVPVREPSPVPSKIPKDLPSAFRK